MKLSLGFSLLELLVVMAIVGILIAVAYPIYTSHLTHSRRNQAAIDLLYLASQLESFYSLQNTYQQATLATLDVKPYTDDHSYQLIINFTTDFSYQIAAAPIGQQAKADSACGTLLFNELGERSVTGSLPANTCWN
jgi:type IV pilus assembly protein PilE